MSGSWPFWLLQSVHPTITYNPSIFDIITFTLQILEKNSDIIKGNRDNNEGVLHYENRFQTFRWQYQGVLLTRVPISRLDCKQAPSRSVSGENFEHNHWDSNVYKSNHFHVHIFRFFFLSIWDIFSKFLLNWSIIFLKSWTSTGYFLNSTGSEISSQFIAWGSTCPSPQTWWHSATDHRVSGNPLILEGSPLTA
jgi:hypothetical protein